MSKRLIASILVSVFGLIGTSGFALADTIGRYECNIIGAIGLEPIGDRDGHLLRSYDYSCVGVDGLLQRSSVYCDLRQRGGWSAGDVSFGSRSSPNRWRDWQWARSSEGTGSTVIQEGKPARATASGKIDLQVRIGHIGCSFRKDLQMDAAKPIGFNRFELEFGD